MSFDDWRMVVVALLTVIMTYSLVGIVAVWGATGRGRWFLRMAAVLSFLAAWLFVSDSRLCLLFLSQTAVVVLRLWFLQSRKKRASPEPPVPSVASPIRPVGRHFSLRDLLLAMVLTSGVLAMLVRLPAEVRWDWYLDVAPGIALGEFTLAAVWVAKSDRSRWLRAAALVALFPALVMGAWLWFGGSARGPVWRAMAALSFVLIAVLPAKLYYGEFESRSLSYPAPLADNAYVDLLTAAESVHDAVNVDQLSGDALRDYLEQHHSALALTRAALARPCQAILPERMDDVMLMAEFRQFEKLAHVLAAQGRLQLQDGNPGEAAKTYFANVELGAAVANGGVMIHDIVGGMTCEMLGIEGLQKAVERLDDAECRVLGERLAAIEARREPLARLNEREMLYIKRAYPFKYRVFALGHALFPEMKSVEPIWQASSELKRARLRLLICHIALRRYWLANLDYSETLGQLVPQFLEEVPLDPYASRPLTYRRLDQTYRLYSVGQDRIDDGGKPVPAGNAPLSAKGDVILDVPASTDEDVPQKVRAP